LLPSLLLTKLHNIRQLCHRLLNLKSDRLDLFAFQAVAVDAKVLLLAADLDSDAWDAHMTFAHRLIHMVSKLHAVALQQLRGEPELTSLTLCPIAHSSQVRRNLSPCIACVYQVGFAGKHQVNVSTFNT